MAKGGDSTPGRPVGLPNGGALRGHWHGMWGKGVAREQERVLEEKRDAGSILALPHLALRSTHSSSPWGQPVSSPEAPSPHWMLDRSQKQMSLRVGELEKTPFSQWG